MDSENTKRKDKFLVFIKMFLCGDISGCLLAALENGEILESEIGYRLSVYGQKRFDIHTWSKYSRSGTSHYNIGKLDICQTVSNYLKKIALRIDNEDYSKVFHGKFDIIDTLEILDEKILEDKKKLCRA